MSQVDNSGPLIVFHPSPGGASDEPADSAEAYGGEGRDFLEGRERAERAAANIASSTAARRAHEELAGLYSARIRRSGNNG